MLESASYAPYHSKKEPWEVTIVHNQTERALFVNAIMASYDRLDVWKNYDPEMMVSAKEKTRTYFLEVPVTIIVTAPIEDDEKKELEAISAVAAFIQNFQLLAWEKQIGITWRTTVNIFDKDFKRVLGLKEDRQIVGLLYLTKVDGTTKIPPARRKPVSNWTKSLSEQVQDE